MTNVFQTVPTGFFNLLASNSKNRLYSDCLLLIYEEYETEVTYRISKAKIRDSITLYLQEKSVELDDEELGQDANIKNYKDLANALIRKFCSEEIGWLEEDKDGETFERHIIMTENAITLAEFLIQLATPEREEFASFITNIFNALRNETQWKDDPYATGLKYIYRNAKSLSKALKRLATFIKDVIKKTMQEESLESLTENIISYCEGDFIREYSRLIKQQNVHMYNRAIVSGINKLLQDDSLIEKMTYECMEEEGLNTYEEAYEKVLDMLIGTKRFIAEDYNRIMTDIKHKINMYMQIAVGRARFLRNKDDDVRGHIEQVMKYIINNTEDIGWKEELTPDLQNLFLLDRSEFLDIGSLRYPRKQQSVTKETFAKAISLTDEEQVAEKDKFMEKINDPHSKEHLKEFLNSLMQNKVRLDSKELQVNSKEDLLCIIGVITVANEAGYRIEPKDDFITYGNITIRGFEIIRNKNGGNI